MPSIRNINLGMLNACPSRKHAIENGNCHLNLEAITVFEEVNYL